MGDRGRDQRVSQVPRRKRVTRDIDWLKCRSPFFPPPPLCTYEKVKVWVFDVGIGILFILALIAACNLGPPFVGLYP